MNISKHILIADDDEDLADAIARRCERLKLEVERAYDAVTALEKIDQLEPDLVILDVNMPGGNGLSLCQMMARDDCLRDIPVIIMTGRQDEATIRSCHDLLAYYVLKSPDVWSRLEPLVRELLIEPRCDIRPTLARQSNDVDAIFTALRCDTGCLALPSDEPSVERRSRRVLCIEDDRDFSSALKRRLEARGVDVQQAFSGMEGYRTAFTSPAQAILLDYEMPDGNGDYVLRRLKENPVTHDIPVIALTGRRDKALERKMTGLGVSRILNKPLDWDTLWSELRPHLEPVPE
jgi:DNA-binding response OmpR family regulator